MTKVNRDPFSNGTEYERWEERNCDRCWKSSHIKKRRKSIAEPVYTPVRCAIQRDIFLRMMSDEPIAQRSYDICQMLDCPNRQESKPRKRYEKHKNEPKLF